MTANVQTCAPGTKLWLLDLGNLMADDGFLLRGAGTSTESNPNPQNKRRSLVCMSVLIEMPGVDGLILFETGCGEGLDKTWGSVLQDIFTPKDHVKEKTLPEQIKKTGHDISQVKHVIIGHMHLDHAGGLSTYFKGRDDVTVYVHEEELKHGFWAIATKMDKGVYLSHYFDPELNWSTFHESEVELFPGLHLIHSPGHTPGLVIMMLHLKESGTFIFTTDQYHIKENYEGHPHGWLARDHNAWYRSHNMIKRLVSHHKAKICFGHDSETFYAFKQNPESYS